MRLKLASFDSARFGEYNKPSRVVPARSAVAEIPGELRSFFTLEVSCVPVENPTFLGLNLPR
jgi:hypothetical protein